MPSSQGSGTTPPGYPTAYECSVRLDDGRRVTIRPILPADADELADAIRSADPETLRMRFLGAPPPLTEAVLDELTRLDYSRRFAVVAFGGRPKRGVGIARYIELPPFDDGTAPVDGARSAEVAVAVTPEWRRVGLASILLQLLAQRAGECGITTFTATYLAANRPVGELATEGHARVLIKQGIGQLSAHVDQIDESQRSTALPHRT
jgi:GNAT superfamily N-acetyltransferase